MPWALAIAAEDAAIGISRRVHPGTSGKADPTSPVNQRGRGGANSERSTRASKQASMTPPKMSRAFRISKDPCWIAEDGDAWGDIREDDRAGGQLGAGTDLATRNDARS